MISRKNVKIDIFSQKFSNIYRIYEYIMSGIEACTEPFSTKICMGSKFSFIFVDKYYN